MLINKKLISLKKIFYFIILLMLVSCSSEKPAKIDTQKPSESENTSVPEKSPIAGDAQYSLEITPLSATRNSTLFLRLKGFNFPDAKLEWIVNGIPVVNPEPYHFEAVKARKGDIVQVVAIVKDKKIVSNTVQIKNTPPQINQLKFIPEVFKPGDTLGVEVKSSDIDGDKVTFLYEWTKNGEPAGNSNMINSALKRGDKVVLKITPFDGEDYGRAYFLDSEILNFPPVILESSDYRRVGNMYIYKISAVDSDGDALTYSLKQGPSGMAIDKSTGVVKWEKPVGYTGKVSFTISVADSYGGETTQELTLEVD